MTHCYKSSIYLQDTYPYIASCIVFTWKHWFRENNAHWVCVIKGVVSQLSPSCTHVAIRMLTAAYHIYLYTINETHHFNITPGVNLPHLFIYWIFLPLFPVSPSFYNCLSFSSLHLFLTHTTFPSPLLSYFDFACFKWIRKPSVENMSSFERWETRLS